MKGNDDTVAIQAAFDAAIASVTAQNQTGGVVYFPCGTYRITAPITSSSITSSFHIRGEGPCSQIYNDSVTPFSSIVINRTSNPGCCVAPNFSIKDIYFITPYVVSTSNYAIELSYVSSPIFDHIQINGYGRGINLSTSYGPQLVGSTLSHITGAAFNCTNDVSCNNATIWGNRFFFVGSGISEAPLRIGPGGANCLANANSVSFIGNDIENSYSGPELHGVCGGTVQDNYIAENADFPFVFTSSINRAVTVTGNYFAGNGTAPAFTSALSDITGLVFGPNHWLDQSLIYGSSLAAVTWSYQSLNGSASLAGYCSEAMNCVNLGNGWIRQWGVTATSSNSGAVTFPLPCPNSAPAEINTSVGFGSDMRAWYSGPSTTGMTVWTSAATGAVSWSVACK